MINLIIFLPTVLSYVSIVYASESDLGGLLSVHQVTNAENLYELGIKQLDSSIKLLEDAKFTGNRILRDYEQTVQYVAAHIGPSGSFIKFSPVIKRLISQINTLTHGLNDALSHVDPFLSKLMNEKSQLVANKNVISQGAEENISKLSTQSARNLLISIKKSLQTLELGELNSRKLNTIAEKIGTDVRHAIKSTNSTLNILLGYRVTFTLVIDSENILSDSEKFKINIFSHSKLCHGTTNEVVNLQHKAKMLFQKSLSEGLLHEDINMGKNYIIRIDSYAHESNKLASEMNAKNYAMASSVRFIRKDIDKLKRILDDYKNSPHSAYKRMDVIHVEIDKIYESIGTALKWANAAVKSNFSILTATRETYQALENLLKISKKSHSIRSTYTTQLDADSNSGPFYASTTAIGDKHDPDDLYGLKHSGYNTSNNDSSSRYSYYVKKFGGHGSRSNHSTSESGEDDCLNDKCCKNCEKSKPWYKRFGLGSVISGIQNMFGASYQQDHSDDDHYPKFPHSPYIIPTAPPIDLVPNDIHTNTRSNIIKNGVTEKVIPMSSPNSAQSDHEKKEPTSDDNKNDPVDTNSTKIEDVAETKSSIETETVSNDLENKAAETEESIDTEPYESESVGTKSSTGIDNDTTVDQNSGNGHNAIKTTNNPHIQSVNPDFQPENPNNPHVNHYGSFEIQANIFGNQGNLENIQRLQQDPKINELIIKGKEFFELFNAVKMKLMRGSSYLNSKMVSIMLAKIFQGSLSNLCYNFNQNRYYYDTQAYNSALSN
ncbi:hypothetical protein BMR1_01G00945 [Babesia microti strain RI]|uniref:Uncharacterized protein n=1 Tax=Babesia microti (strain RI) TaxID=1133968 RepID=I7IFB1_BABMR|nr:hypothetical protein BMR1_01G00945 [Babesia microti strain RI]CCF72651.1 hypothetical protein BMR1_01G00945 [Babesia microti strain RI]|eukprot:XP_012647260.1 hypothetical protein BMR1_01G00945 [Babesia microti strain RI]